MARDAFAFYCRDSRTRFRLNRRLCFVGFDPRTGGKKVIRWLNYCLVRKRPSDRAAPIFRKLCKLADETFPFDTL